MGTRCFAESNQTQRKRANRSGRNLGLADDPAKRPYDPLSRLSIATTAGSTNYPAWGLQETYDRYGNRTLQSTYSGCTGITCPTNSVSVSLVTNRITSSGYGYDANGNMTNDGQNILVYDGENRAVSATVTGSSSGTYTYDGNGLRVQKVSVIGSNSTTTVYIFSGSKVIAEYDNGAAIGSPSREYIYSGSTLLAKIDSSGTKYYHKDHLSNRLVTDNNGNTLAQMGHFPYGESWYNATNDKLLFTTYERDSESGNDYAMARYNVSRLARFTSPDILSGDISAPQSLNHYPYVDNNPISFVDPSGMLIANTCDPEFDIGCPVGGGDGGFGGPCGDNFFPTMYNPCDPTIPTFGGPTAGGPHAGGHGGAIDRAKQLVLQILSGDNECARFFNIYAKDYEYAVDSILSSSTPAADIFSSDNITEDPKGPSLITKEDNGMLAQPWAGMTSQSTGWNSDISLNGNGAFFNYSAFIKGTTNRGDLTIGGTTNGREYGGNTPEARVTILFHELAHNIDAIPTDSSSAGQSTKNTQTILDHCKGAIDAAVKQKN
jgi:RHS repeat-associated protein